MTTAVARLLLGVRVCAVPLVPAEALFTFETHHAKDTKAANSNQMEHLEFIKVYVKDS